MGKIPYKTSILQLSNFLHEYIFPERLWIFSLLIIIFQVSLFWLHTLYFTLFISDTTVHCSLIVQQVGDNRQIIMEPVWLNSWIFLRHPTLYWWQFCGWHSFHVSTSCYILTEFEKAPLYFLLVLKFQRKNEYCLYLWNNNWGHIRL